MLFVIYDCFTQAESSSEHVRQASMGVQKAFSKIKTFMLPPPSSDVRRGSEPKGLRVSGTVTHLSENLKKI